MKHTHVNPGCDVTVDPRPPIDDSCREKKMTMRKYCPNCKFFRDMESGSREHPPIGALTPDMLENENGSALYGCYCPKAWIEPMPMRVIDIQLIRAVECSSFLEREPLTEAEKKEERR